MARDMIDDGLDDMRCDAKLGHVGDYRAPDVVHGPRFERLTSGSLDGGVQPLLANMPAAETALADSED